MPYRLKAHYQKRPRHKDNRKSASKRGYDAHWRKKRAWYLKSNPLCKLCSDKGLATPATVVDHVIPHKGNRKLFNDPENWQSLCTPCHDSAKRRQENMDRPKNIGVGRCKSLPGNDL